MAVQVLLPDRLYRAEGVGRGGLHRHVRQHRGPRPRQAHRQVQGRAGALAQSATWFSVFFLPFFLFLLSDFRCRVGCAPASAAPAALTGRDAAQDDYSYIMAEALADRLAEAVAEKVHEDVRKDFWGYSPEESFGADDLLKVKYRVRRTRWSCSAELCCNICMCRPCAVLKGRLGAPVLRGASPGELAGGMRRGAVDAWRRTALRASLRGPAGRAGAPASGTACMSRRCVAQAFTARRMAQRPPHCRASAPRRATPRSRTTQRS